MATGASQDDGGAAVQAGATEGETAGGKEPKEMYTDEYIRLWEPLDPLDPDRMTLEHKKVIMQKLYVRSAPIYNRLAEL